MHYPRVFSSLISTDIHAYVTVLWIRWLYFLVSLDSVVYMYCPGKIINNGIFHIHKCPSSDNKSWLCMSESKFALSQSPTLTCFQTQWHPTMQDKTHVTLSLAFPLLTHTQAIHQTLIFYPINILYKTPHSLSSACVFRIDSQHFLPGIQKSS